MRLVKFRRGMREQPFETPEWVPVVLALRDLIESLDRLTHVTKMGEGYANNTSVLGVRSNSSRGLSQSDGVLGRENLPGRGDGRHDQQEREDHGSMFV